MAAALPPASRPPPPQQLLQPPLENPGNQGNPRAQEDRGDPSLGLVRAEALPQFRFESDRRLEYFGHNFELTMKQFYQNTLIEVIEGLETLFIYVRNLLQNPGDHRFANVASSNMHFQERLGCLIGAKECMQAIGFDPDHNGWNYKFDYKAFANDQGWMHLNGAKEEIVQRLEVLRKQFEALPVRLPEDHCYSSVVAAGSYHECGQRPTMEDDEMLVDGFLDRSGYGFFALYDGHGGRETVEFVVKVMQMNLAQVMVQLGPEVHLNEAVMRAYELTDAQLRRQNILKSGTTAVTCVVKPADGDYDEAADDDWGSDADDDASDDENAEADGSDFDFDDDSASDGYDDPFRRRRRSSAKAGNGAGPSSSSDSVSAAMGGKDETLNRPRFLYVSNVGDSRAVLCRGRRAVRLTVDHKANLLEEGERVVEAGGFVSRKRVNGILAISRALGDHMLKERSDVVSCIPYCTVTRLRPKRDRYLLLACDGVWDVMSDQQAVDFVLDHVDQIAHEKAAQQFGCATGPEELLRSGRRDDYQRLMNDVLTETSAELVRQALDKGSTDNVTVIILQLNWPQ